MEEQTTESIVAKSKKGMMSLSARSIVIYGLQTISLLLLSHWLEPKDYGIFAIFNGWIGVSYYFTDIGITGSLIHQDSAPTERQLQTLAGTEFYLSLFFCIIFWLFAPRIAAYSKLDPSSVWMFRLLALILPIQAIRACPKIQFDRHLNFSVQAKIDISEMTILYIIQIGSAYLGFGAWSFIIAALARVVSGTLLLYAYYKKIHFPILHWYEIKKLLPYGLPFQANAALPALRGLILPVIVAGLLPVSSVGIITWTFSLASIPLFLALNYNQVIFSSLSRLQRNIGEYKRIASRSTELAFLIFGFLFAAAASCGVSIIAAFFNVKWAASYALFPIAALAVGLSTFRYLLGAIFNSSGKPHMRLKIEMVSIVGEFIFVWLMTYKFKDMGYMWSTVFVNAVALSATLYFSRHHLRTATFVRCATVLAAGALSYLLIYILKIEKNIYLTVPVFIFSFSIFSILLDSMVKKDKERILDDFHTFMNFGFKTPFNMFFKSK